MESIGGCRTLYPWLRHIFADGAYPGDKLKDALSKLGTWTFEIIKDPIPRKASRFCRVDGLSREHSHGSNDAAGSPKTSRPPSQARSPGFSSPISAALRGGSQELESNQVFMSRNSKITGKTYRLLTEAGMNTRPGLSRRRPIPGEMT
jgi:hypothetical protein